MVDTLKQVVIPYLSYLLVWGVSLWALLRSPTPALYVYAVLSPLPMLWYPAQELPAGTLLLTVLVASVLVGARLKPGPDATPAPNGRFVLWFLGLSYLALWNTSLRFGLSMPVSFDNEVLRYWKNFAMMVLLYFAAFHGLRTERQVRTLVFIVAGVLLFMAWREVLNFAAGGSFSYGSRANGPFWMLGMNANHFGAFVAHFSIFALGVSAVDDAKGRKRLMLLAFIASLYPLFFSYSRGAYVAVLAGLLVLGLVRQRGLLLVVGVVMLFWDSILPDSVVDRIQMTDSDNGELEESAALRLVMWDLAKHLFGEHPVFGIGFAGFSYASEGLPLHNVHNYFLQVACEEGVVGLALMAMLFWKAVSGGWELYREGSTPFLRGVGLGFIACTFAVVVTNLFGDRFSELELGGYFWLLLGAVHRALLLSRAPQPQPAAGAVHAPLVPSR